MPKRLSTGAFHRKLSQYVPTLTLSQVYYWAEAGYVKATRPSLSPRGHYHISLDKATLNLVAETFSLGQEAVEDIARHFGENYEQLRF